MPPTSRTKAALGLLGAVIILSSSAAHGFLGWPAVSNQLTRAGVAPDLLRGQRVGWLFGSVSMVVFGIIAAWIFGNRLRGRLVPTFPALVIGVAYGLFGVWATAVTHEAFFPVVFMIPGLLLAIASLASER